MNWYQGGTVFAAFKTIDIIDQITLSEVIRDESDPLIDIVLGEYVKKNKKYIKITMASSKPFATVDNDRFLIDLTERYNTLLEKEGK